jgi:glucokinase
MSGIIGIDFGGTSIKMGLVSEKGVILNKTNLPFDAGKPFGELIDAVCASLQGMPGANAEPIQAIGIATPGYADPATGILIDGTQNVPALKGRSLPKEFSERLRVPSFIDNDGTCAAIGELRFGAGRGFRNFALITLGTGIGGGVVVDREIVTGSGGTPPEIGAICLDPGGPVNYSGIPGTFERLACASGFQELYLRLGGREQAQLNPQDIFRLAQEGDEAGRKAVGRLGRYIAQAFGIMINLLNLEACLIGGGMAAAGVPLLQAVEKHLPSFAWPNLLRNARVLPAELGNDAGVVGAAALATQRMSRPKNNRRARGGSRDLPNSKRKGL